jgi:probable rRNA maturation factor
MRIKIDVVTESKEWLMFPELIAQKALVSVATKVLEHFACFANKSLSLSILLADDNKLRELNKQFRDKDNATNVLSFPDIFINYPEIETIKWPKRIYLGDLAFSLATIKQEALSFNLELNDHFTHLLVHAILHLLGYDHEEMMDANIMEQLEITILAQLGLQNPYRSF